MARLCAIALAIGCFFFAAPAHAGATQVTYDPANDTGYAPRIAVQIALNWNNQKYQSEARSLPFYNEQHEIYTAVCAWAAGSATRTVDYKVFVLLAAVTDPNPPGTVIKGHFIRGIRQPAEFTEVGVVPRAGMSCVGDDGSAGSYTSSAEIYAEQFLTVTDGYVVLWRSSQP